MNIRPKDKLLLWPMRYALFNRIELSRFRVHNSDLTVEDNTVKIMNVRLREYGDYCGQHPGPCIINPFVGERPHKRTKYLQGSDWVGFNKLINDLFDERKWEAFIWSGSMEFRGKMRIRLGRLRRMRYGVTYSNWGHPSWDAPGDEEDFEDWCGRKAPPERYPSDTPGTPEWRRPRPPRTRKAVMAQLLEDPRNTRVIQLDKTQISKLDAITLLKLRMPAAPEQSFSGFVDRLYGTRKKMTVAQLLETVFIDSPLEMSLSK